MSLVAFDTLEYSNKLKEAGENPKVAEVQAEQIKNILHSLIENKLSTKEDLKKTEELLKTFIIKTAFSIIGLLGGLQTLFHFVK